MLRIGNGLTALATVFALSLAACGGEEETPPMGDVGGEMPMNAMEGMDQAQEMTADSGVMRRHAQEADSMVSAMRQNLERMRRLPAEEWHDHMAEHVGHSSGMLTLMNRQMREMDMGMGMSGEHMGQMMGMSGEDHRQMMEEMQGLRSELEQLQLASRERVRELMPAHLDRIERMVETMKESAEHMGSM